MRDLARFSPSPNSKEQTPNETKRYEAQMTTKSAFLQHHKTRNSQNFEFHILTVAVVSFSFSKKTTSLATIDILHIFTDCDWQTFQISSIFTAEKGP